ncbi:MAG: hypothetical protein PHQ13_03450 [Rhodoferax sp.]|nr:hypothetical protein [Rhodoferax sp.]
MNYQALGEHTAYTAQAKDAASSRFSHLHNLGGALIRASKNPQEPFDPEKLRQQLDQAVACDREMRAALARANQAAALCDQPEITLKRFERD